MNRTLVLLLVLFGIVFSQDQEPAVETQELEEGSAPVAAWSDAYLLVRRSITAKDDVFVTDVDLTVELYAINVGTSTAFGFEAIEEWPAGFTVSEEDKHVHFDSIAPEAVANHTYIVRCTVPGEYTLAGTKITYHHATPEGEEQVGQSSRIGKLFIEDAAAYAKRTDPHIKEWLFFSAICSVLVLLPFAGWSYYQLYYEDGVKITKQQ